MLQIQRLVIGIRRGVCCMLKQKCRAQYIRYKEFSKRPVTVNRHGKYTSQKSFAIYEIHGFA